MFNQTCTENRWVFDAWNLHEILNSSHSFDLRRLDRSTLGFPKVSRRKGKIPKSSSDVMVNNLQFWGRTRNFCWKFWVSGISSSTSQFFEPFEDTTDSPFIQKEQRFKKWWELWAHFFWKWRVLTLRSKKWLKKFIVQKKWKFAHLKFNSSLLEKLPDPQREGSPPNQDFSGASC